MKKHVSYRRNAARFIYLLMQGHHSLAELAELTPMDYERARVFVHDLKAEGVVHVCAWRRDSRNRNSIALYQLGLGVDAPKPTAKTGVQRTRAYKQRKEYKPLHAAPVKINAPVDVFDFARRA
jgi:hypothetical protein